MSIHRQTTPFPHRWGISSLACLQQFHGSFWSQTLIIVIIQLNHGCIRTSPQTLNLQQRKQSILCCLPILNSQMLFNRLLNVFTSTNHAGSSAAKLNEVFADFGPIKHGVKTGDFIHTRGIYFDNLGHFIHRCHGEPSSVLTLSEVKEGDNTRLFVVGRIFGENFVNTGVVFVREVKVCFRGIVWGVNVLIWMTKMVMSATMFRVIFQNACCINTST